MQNMFLSASTPYIMVEPRLVFGNLCMRVLHPVYVSGDARR